MYAKVKKIIFECPNCKKEVESDLDYTCCNIELATEFGDIAGLHLACSECGQEFQADLSDD